MGVAAPEIAQASQSIQCLTMDYRGILVTKNLKQRILTKDCIFHLNIRQNTSKVDQNSLISRMIDTLKAKSK
jgi:hypothetical protein